MTLLASAGSTGPAEGPSCYSRLSNEWVCADYLRDYRPEIQDATIEHVQITLLAVVLGVAIAFPLALTP